MAFARPLRAKISRSQSAAQYATKNSSHAVAAVSSVESRKESAPSFSHSTMAIPRYSNTGFLEFLVLRHWKLNARLYYVNVL